MFFWLTKKTAYNEFSQEFSQTRKIPLPEFLLFSEELEGKKKILYIGCGNGRNIPLLQKNGAEITGLDASEGLLKEAKKNVDNRHAGLDPVSRQKNKVRFIHGYAENLPFEDEEFDAIVAFASLHHITNTKKRKKAFEEAFRVLKKNGVFMGTVWNLYQKRFLEHEKKAKTRARFLPWWSENDFLIPWGQKKLPRLYYRFSGEELENLLKKNGFEDIEICSQNREKKKVDAYGGMNICFMGKKTTTRPSPFKGRLGGVSDDGRQTSSSLEKNTTASGGSSIPPCNPSLEGGRIQVLGVPFDAITKAEVLEKMEQAARGKKQIFVTTPNPEICMAAQKDKDFLHILQSADISIADGIGILWAANQLRITNPSITNTEGVGTRFIASKKKSLLLSLLRFALHRKSKILPEQICGSDVFKEFCTQTKQPIFLLGGAPDAAKKCQKIFNNSSFRLDRNPSEKKMNPPQSPLIRGEVLPIVDTDDRSSKAEDEARIIKKINASGATVLFVAFGAPAQEKWIQKNLKKMPNIKLAMGVGGSFDFVAGVQKRAPKLFRKIGAEWAWRLLLEPKKRGKRILTAVWSFPRKVWRG